MIELSKLVKVLKDEKLGPVTGVPCSVFKDFLNYIIENEAFEHYTCSSEGESMGIAAGFALAGKLPIVYMQNDGYGNAINPLSSLQLMYELPVLMMISWRGEPGKKDAPQHKLMGETIEELLDVFEIPHAIVGEDNYDTEIKKSKIYMERYNKPYALIFKKGIIEKYHTNVNDITYYSKRIEYLEDLSTLLNENDIVIGTTGFTGRELYQTLPQKAKFYMMGSMGCLPSIGLGLAQSKKDRNIFVLDGDGALLMKLGSMSTIGNYQPKNIIHICFDNNAYGSTGCQQTTSNTTDFSAIAKACNYRSFFSIDSVEKFKEIITSIEVSAKPIFLLIKINSGTIENLKRPSLSPVEMKKNFMGNL